MIHRFFILATLIVSACAFGCDRRPVLNGVLWYGQGDRIASFDLADRSIRYSDLLQGCSGAGADPLGRSFAFVCTKEDRRALYAFSIPDESLSFTGVEQSEPMSDPALSPDGARTLVRFLRSGDVFDVQMHFRKAGHGKLAGRVGAACFGQDNDSIYLAQGSLVALHLIQDITRPDRLPAGGLKALVTAPGTVRDLHYHVGLKKLALCAGTSVLVCDFTGANCREVFDSTRADLAGPLRLPYRVRWSPDGSRLAIVLSPNGDTGTFAILDVATHRRLLLEGPKPTIGGFAWTKERPSAFW